MPTVSIALIRESNRLLSTAAKQNVVARSAKLSQEAINQLMQQAFLRLNQG